MTVPQKTGTFKVAIDVHILPARRKSKSRGEQRAREVEVMLASAIGEEFLRDSGFALSRSVNSIRIETPYFSDKDRMDLLSRRSLALEDGSALIPIMEEGSADDSDLRAYEAAVSLLRQRLSSSGKS